MSPKDKIFSLASIFLVGAGFFGVVAGADKHGDKTVMTVQELVHEIKNVEEVDQINKGKLTPTTNEVATAVPAHKTALTQSNSSSK